MHTCMHVWRSAAPLPPGVELAWFTMIHVTCMYSTSDMHVFVLAWFTRLINEKGNKMIIKEKKDFLIEGG